jgi:hypothetical protein
MHLSRNRRLAPLLLSLIIILSVLRMLSCGLLHKPEPIPPDKQTFVGVWVTASGFRFDIRVDGTADITQIADTSVPDYERLNLKVAPRAIEGIYVRFREGDFLEVVKPTLYAREYHIDSYPSEDSHPLKMVLNGVPFEKRE